MRSLKVLFVACIGFLGVCSHNVHENESPLVNSPSGTVKGSFLTSRLGRKFNSFRGIRYAEPPVGHLRFRPPVEHTWTGVFDASEDGPMCPQGGYNNTSEDCLRLNVYTPKLPHGRNHSKLPVILFIHDGGFYAFSGTWLLRGPEYFLDQNIVLVTINYRLAILGFLSTGDAEAPGNNGLKDQVLAMKWVKKNIEAFGGDKDCVTLLGYSAGSHSITFHMVSPMARGLFHKAIIMSGSGLGAFPIEHDQKEYAKKQASLVGCPSDTSKNIVDCLRTKTPKEITDTLGSFAEISYNPILMMAPVIENDFGQERFLTEHPIKLFEQKNFYDVPVLIGRNKDEVANKAYQILANATATKMANDDFKKYAPILFVYERGTEKSNQVSRAIKRFYLNNEPISNATLPGFAKLFADAIMGFPVHRAAELIAKNGNKPVYYYKVTYLGEVTDFYVPGSNNTIPYGVVHEDEMTYLFVRRTEEPFLSDENYPIGGRSVAKLTKLLANFAATGNPTPKADELFNNARWETFDVHGQKYMDIGKTLQMKDRMFEERYNLWKHLFPISYYLH